MNKLPFISVIMFLAFNAGVSSFGQELQQAAFTGDLKTRIEKQEYDKNLEELLFELPDLIFKKLDSSQGSASAYLVKVKQPIDHNDLSKGSFYQKVFLTHKGFDRPTVLVTEGYGMWENSDYELTELLNANQVKVEHRFYGDSKPGTMEYSYLNLAQAALDLHHIRQLLGDIYAEKWISTGLSKGGTTAIVYRYFYPDDVDVCVPLAGPLILSNSDQRFIAYLDTLYSADCQKKIRSFQLRLLENRDRILPLIEFYALGARNNFTINSPDRAFEYGVLEYQNCLLESGSCEEIPGSDESIESITKHFLEVVKFHWFSDKFIHDFSSYFYQSATEIGGYGYDTTGLGKLLFNTPINQDPRAIVAPCTQNIIYDGKLMNDVAGWLTTHGNRFIYLYGTSDFWTAAAVTPSKKVDSEWFFLKGGNHENTMISVMTDAQRKRLISTLEQWLSLEIEDVFIKKE